VAPGSDGGVGAGRGGHDQLCVGPGEVQGGCVQEEEVGKACDVHHQHGGSLEIHTSSRPTILSNFIKDFPNLKVKLSSISSSTNSQNCKITNITVGESEGGVLTNLLREIFRRDLQLTNQEQALQCGGKR
jgi:hypothetical protein